MTAAISLQDVSKRYGSHTAVADLNLAVAPGEVLGFLGANGAGKTTTIRLLTGFLRPTTGTVRLLGHDMAQPAQALRARRHLGFVPDLAGLDPTVSARVLLDQLAALQQQAAVDRAHLIEALALAPRDLERPMGRLSRGTRQKINLVQGMQHRPDLLVLDEPTEGLDPITKRALFELLQEARLRGATIFFSSHILSEVEELCDRVALIRQGHLVAVETLADLRRHLPSRVTLQLQDASVDVETQLRRLPSLEQLVHEEGRWRFLIRELPPLLQLLGTLPVEDLTIEPPSLETAFWHYYRAHEPSGADEEAPMQSARERAHD
jgi:ABC-2 type transport system ATP-binding protein